MAQMEGQAGAFAASVDGARNVRTIQNVVGYAVGEKIAFGQFTNELAVKVYVVRKLPMGRVDDEAKIPTRIKIDGKEFATDVVETGEIVASSTSLVPIDIQAVGVFTDRERPARGGSSVGHFKITAGTLGCLCVVDGKLCILSNNHVLANVNKAKKGDPILQAGPLDGGTSSDKIAVLQDFVEIDFSGSNEVDGAVALTNFKRASPDHREYTIDPEPVDPSIHLTVRKCGRTTGHTLGDVAEVNATINVRYGNQVARFDNQVRIVGRHGGDFSQGGDSGSLIVTAGTLQPVALLFAGGTNGTFANPIQAVMDALGIERFIAEEE